MAKLKEFPEPYRPFVGIYYQLGDSNQGAWWVFLDIDADMELIPDGEDEHGMFGFLGSYPFLADALRVFGNAWSEYHRRTVAKELRLIEEKDAATRETEALAKELRGARVAGEKEARREARKKREGRKT